MNKTRMGKRVASLLLSLVMMLSLLPTAAYAAMGDADETQGASVSENGTRVSDDSNSGGDTGDLQVGDSEDGGNTGDQKVEGSNGSNTVGDTAGTEGGADPTDSVNENDSTLVTPSNRVEVNGTVYDTLEAAIAAAEPVNGVITYEIYGKVEANSTESWIEVLKAGLTDVTKVAFVGKTDDAEISITNSTSVLADQNYDIDVSFVDLTLSHSNGAWVGDIGHATEYFTCVLRNTDAANNTVTYTNCTFPNGACNNQYGKTVFVNCEFTNTTSGKYNLWNYGGTTEITKSAFTGTRGIKTYNEGTLAESPEVAIKDTTFTGLTEKAAIVASKPTDIKLDSISATECTKGVFQKDIEGSADAEKVTIEANGSGISGNFNVTAEKTTEAAKDEFNITAGSFTAEVPSDYCAEGFTIEKKADGSYGVKENQPSANVAKVGDTEYATLGEAIAALSSSSYTLELLDESAWDVATPVYWAAGSESGYVATLADALTAAYMANAGGITIVCRPGTDVGKLTHGHVADNITIYGNNAYISSGECDLEVDTYMFSRDTGKQVTTGGAYLDKDITVTAYELDNLGVWGQRHTGHKVTVNLTDCDSVHGITVQRVYISGTTGVNDITLTGCDFGTKATSVYSNADGKVVIDNCSFTGAQVPVNFNHKANGTQTVTVQNSKFTNCGDNGDWKQFAAPVRFVNSGSGTMNTTVGTCTFTDTVGGNGDILLGDGREGEKSNNVSLTVENTAANVQAQQPGYYAKNGTTDESKQGTKNVAADDKLTTSVTQLMPSSETTYVAEVKGVKYKSLQAAIDKAGRNATVKLLADVEQNTQLTINKSITLDLNGKTIRNTVDIWGDKANAILSITNGAKVTITGNGTIDAKENDCYTINVAKGDLTIENGTFYGNVSVVQVEEGTLSVKGGTFDLHQKWEGSSKYLFNCIDSEFTSGNAKVAISGGTFVGFDPNVSPEQKVDGKTPSFAAPGVGITKNENGSFTAAAGMTAQILDKDGNSVKAYNTLAEAVAAAQDGQTVRLLADVTLNEQIATGKAITIDGQSKYTIKTVKKLASVDGKAGMFYRTQSAKGTLTFLNVTLDGGGVSKIFLNEGGAGETVFDGVTSTNGGGIAYGSGIHISGGGSHATIRNSTLTGSTGTMELNDANYYAANDLWVGGNVYVTVENSVIGNVFVNSAPSATATNGVVHGQLTITGEKTKITYLSGEEEAADKLDKFGNNGSLVKIDSGYVEKVFDKGSYAISGGTFKTEVKKEWCAAGYVPTQNGDGTYGVAEGKFTVQVTSRTTGSDSPVANVAGGGSDITYAVGTTVTASAISGYKFVGWFVNEYTGTAYSTDLTCEVKPTDDWTMIAVYEPISGGKFWLNVTASEFTVNGGAVQDSYLYEQFAVGASVTVNFTGSENFLYWVNASNKVVSTEKSYTFVMGSETTLKAVYGKACQNQATVVFISHSDQIISSKAYTTNDTIQFPVPPIKMGCTFTGWSMTEAEIRAAMANNSGIIQVRARYTEPSIACKVTVIYPDGIGNDVVNAVVGKAVNVTAKDIEGKTFSYWTDNAGNVLGYTKTLNLAPSGDMTVKAVYDEAAEAKPVITISEVSATTANESYVVTFMATRAVPDGYKVVKQGILWSRDAVCGEDGAAAYMQFDSNGKLPTGVNAYIGNSLELNGVTRLDITTKYNDRTFYGRGYMVLESDAGELLYIYTNTIESGSYDSLTK